MSMGSLALLATEVGGQLSGPDRSFDAVSTDTRSLAPGQLFFALRGERFDAAEFVAEAAARGAVGAVVERHVDVDLPQVEVADTRIALGAFARAWRLRFELPVIGITGSNGKTTVKELTAAIMHDVHAAEGPAAVLATEGNLNNDIGVPLTLLRLRPTHRAAVIEMGANKPGDIAVLAHLAAINIGIITNAARAHLQGFGTVADVARTKGQLLDELGEEGTAVLNRDDTYFSDWRTRAGAARVVSFGMASDADYRATNIRQEIDAGQSAFRFDLHSPAGSIEIALPLAGRHNVANALAAAAAAMAAGATLEHVREGLANSRNVPGRLRAFEARSGAVIYDDSYNANPDSMMAGIDFVAAQAGEPWLVLGDMGELGSEAEALHRQVGAHARAAGIRHLLCVGEHSRATADAFGPDARWYADIDALQADLLEELRPGRNVLVKASRFMGLDRLVRAIESGTTAAVGSGA